MTPEGGFRNLADIWTECVRRFPRRSALRAVGMELSYSAADARIRKLAGNLRARYGIACGDRVCLLMQNCPEFYLAYWAVHLAGGIVAAVSPRMGRREIASVIRAADAGVVLHDGCLLQAAAGVSVRAEAGPDLLHEMAADDGGSPPEAETGPDDLAVLAHTSGTTGEPKIAQVRHADLFFNLRTAILAHSLRHEDVILVGVPMFHCTPLYSLLPAAAYLGATIVVTAATAAPAQAAEGRRAQATVWFGVPTLFHQLSLAGPDVDGSMQGMRLLAYAGSPMRPEVIGRLGRRWERLALHNFFGLTETISMTHVLPACDALARADSVGKALPEVYARICADDGAAVPRGQTGELCFHRRNVISGYWGRPGLIEKSMDGDWYRTGDLAMEDEDGYLYLRGRSKDVIIVAGENVYASEVEAVLSRCPGVEEAAVVGVPAEGVRASLGELLKAVIVRSAGSELSAADLKRFAAAELASYKVPHIVEFRDGLPRNASGKVLKGELR